jgi:hypothetical protein
MSPDSIGITIERAFGELDPLPISHLDREVRFGGDEVVEAVRFRTWKELRPLKDHFPDGWILGFFSARTFQYYLPAFLYALAEGEGGACYLDPVLQSLGYRHARASFERGLSWFRSPERGWRDAAPEARQAYLQLPEDERRKEAECRADIARKMALGETKGVNWGYDAYLSSADRRFAERMAVLTEEQKRCIALSLAFIQEQYPDGSYAHCVQEILDHYWRSFLPRIGEASDDHQL